MTQSLSSIIKGPHSHVDPVLRGAVDVARGDLGEYGQVKGGSELHHRPGKTRGESLSYQVLIELCGKGVKLYVSTRT